MVSHAQADDWSKPHWASTDAHLKEAQKLNLHCSVRETELSLSADSQTNRLALLN